jgi:magnesium-transporting ATPase (P-type)
MSCIVRNEDGRIILMCKGADSVIEERLNFKSFISHLFNQTKIAVNAYANEGLRTLLLAEREIDE